MTEMVLGIGKARASNRAATVDRPGRRIRSARPSNRRSHRQGRPAAHTRPRRRKRGGAASACAWTSRNRPAPHPPETDPARVDLHVEHRPRTHEAGDLTGYALGSSARTTIEHGRLPPQPRPLMRSQVSAATGPPQIVRTSAPGLLRMKHQTQPTTLFSTKTVFRRMLLVSGP